MRNFFAKMLLGTDTISKLQKIQQTEVLEAEAGKKPDGSIAETPKVSSPTITREQIRSLIEIDMEIHGDVFIGRGVKVSGRVKGNLIPNGAIKDCDPIVIISQGGNIDGDLHARVVVVAGSLDGDIHAEHVLLMPTAKVNGNVNYRHTLRQDIGSALAGMVRRVDGVPLLDHPPMPADRAKPAITQIQAIEPIPAMPPQAEESRQAADASAIPTLIRTPIAIQQSNADIEHLYQRLDISGIGERATGTA
ncbi:hypothetical protein DK842_22645 [Chromobacterium phragmitis]|uniref:Polymer-forming cytoskeletal protein n=1 Tax=Chromobacterium phragmitis TaxID=2202141 RepID=A0ABV0IMJ6_9NEIS|nr:polymer-forming cytoskeletal protein [Chromobacterium phragmitis]AXE32466.1 hypothetical protein DK842_22645 [Chromobacterium phragmitis]